MSKCECRSANSGIGIRHSISALLLALTYTAAVAGDLQFSAGVDRTEVGLGERLVLTVTVTGTNIGRVPKPQLPQLDDFDNLGGSSSQSTNIAFAGGRLTQQQTISHIYHLLPKKLGELTIGPVRMEFKGETYLTQPIAVNVVKESRLPPPTSRRRPDPFDPFRSPQPQPGAGGAVKENVHLGATASRTSVFQGEQVTVGYTFYTRLNLGDLQIADMPAFSGFWVEKLFDARDLDYKAREYRGQQYNAASIKRVALFPTRSGELVVGSMKMTGQVVRRGGFFFQSAEPFEVKSGPITITVKPLPDSGKPSCFTGGVGEFELTAGLDKDSSIDGEPLSLTVKVTGTGNIRLVGEPKVGPVMGVKLLSPETKDKVNTSSGKVKGSREFSYPLMPEADGKLLIPSIKLGFFDPKTETYYVCSTPRLEIFSSGAAGRTSAIDAGTGVRLVGSDIRHIKGNVEVRVSKYEFGNRHSAFEIRHSWWVWLFYPAGLIVLAFGVVLGRHRRKLEHDRGYARRRRSSRLVKKRLAEATRLLEQGRESDFHAALNRAVLGYVGDRFNIEAHGLTGDELRTELVRGGVSEETTTALLDLVKTCDAARFSPGMAATGPDETLDRARRVLEAL